ncbi:MAG: alpha/beta hydrolase [Parvularculaceae bacterium]|nr:alpha/beta hydrolase [Parvularculaceae bacterium]
MRYVEDFYTSTDGLRLFFRDYGPEDVSAAPVLCLPGLTRNSRDFDDLARRLAVGRRVVCPDLRGRGNSDWDTDYRNYNPSVYVGDVNGLLDAIGIDKVLMIGTSLGGLLAMIIAATQPELVRGIVINDAGPEVDPKGLARITQYAGRHEPATSWEEAANACRVNYGEVIPGLSDAEWAHFARQGFREDNGVIRLDMDPRIGDAMRELNTTPASIWPVYEMLRDTPTLVIRGANSDILSQTTLEKMAEMKPDLQSAIIPDRGHAPLLNEPASLSAIDAFLDAF